MALGEAASLPAGAVTTPEAAQAAARYPFLLTRRALSSPFPEGPRRAQLLARLAERTADLHERMAAHDQSDYEGLGRLNEELREAGAETASLEERWLELAEQVEG